jgi:hypothetical protein
VIDPLKSDSRTDSAAKAAASRAACAKSEPVAAQIFLTTRNAPRRTAITVTPVCLIERGMLSGMLCQLRHRSCRTLNGKLFVAAPGVNTQVVNRTAADLFPLTIMLYYQFIPAAITSRRGFETAGSNSEKQLKTNSFLY